MGCGWYSSQAVSTAVLETRALHLPQRYGSSISPGFPKKPSSYSGFANRESSSLGFTTTLSINIFSLCWTPSTAVSRT